MLKRNFFNEVEIHRGHEFFETLLSGKYVKIERIISFDLSPTEGGLYDQTWDEWVIVIQGNAVVRFFDPDEDVEMKTGDFVFIPARKKHSVIYTDNKKKTIWLAVHLFNQ